MVGAGSVDRHRYRGADGLHRDQNRRTAPSYHPAYRSTPRRCRPCRRYPAARLGSQPYSVTESKAVDRRLAGAVLGQRLKPAVGFEGVALAGKHARRIFAFTLKRKHPRRVGELAREVVYASAT